MGAVGERARAADQTAFIGLMLLTSTLRRTNSDDAPAPIFDGKLSGTCPLPGGGSVTLDVWWRDCD